MAQKDNLRQRKNASASGGGATAAESNKDKNNTTTSVKKQKKMKKAGGISQAEKEKAKLNKIIMYAIGGVVILSLVFFYVNMVVKSANKPTVELQQPPQFTSPYAKVSSYRLHEVMPHDDQALVQGITIDPDNENIMYESVGEYGKSEIRKINLETGEIIQRKAMDLELYAGGLTYYPSRNDSSNNKGGRLLVLTKSKRAYVYDSETLETIGTFEYETTTYDGWGVTYNPKDELFYVSDGSPFLHVWDVIEETEVESGRETTSVSHQAIQKIEITVQTEYNDDEPKQAAALKDLEFCHATQTVLANVFEQDVILRIDPSVGKVRMIYSFRNLYSNRTDTALSFNGLALSNKKTTGAHDAETKLWITGQNWPQMYHVSLLNTMY